MQVKGFMKDGNAVLQVIDNGVGMDEETLSHIYDKHKVNYHSNGVGVYNVQKRLKLYYGENYGITYESEKGVGTTATITIREYRRNQYEKHRKTPDFRSGHLPCGGACSRNSLL